MRVRQNQQSRGSGEEPLSQEEQAQLDALTEEYELDGEADSNVQLGDDDDV